MSTDGQDHARKDAARKRQKVTGESYMRARREVMPRRPLSCTVGVDNAGRPLRVNLEQPSAGGSGPHCIIAGNGSCGKTTLAQKIGRQFAAQQDVEVIVNASEELREFYGEGITFLAHSSGDRDRAALTTALTDLLTSREGWLKQAQVPDIEAARAQGHRIRDAVVILDDEQLWNRDHDSELAVQRLVRLGRSLGIHVITLLKSPDPNPVTESIRANSSTVLTLAGGVGVGTIGTGVVEFPRTGPAAAAFSFAPPR